MKKLLIFFLLLCTARGLFAQTHKFPLDSAHYWRYYRSWYQPPNNTCNCNYNFRFEKDSVIGGLSYQQMKPTGLVCNGTLGNPCYFPGDLLVRQDTVNKLFIFRTGNEDKILFNFDKSVGDTALLFLDGMSMSTYTLQGVDSILLNDGFYHKRYNWGYNNIIEGIGGMGGIMPYFIGLGFGETLDCVARQTNFLLTLYPPGTSPCEIYTTSVTVRENEDDDFHIRVYPNPARSEIIFYSGAFQKPARLVIFNTLGLKIREEEVTKEKTKLDISDFMPGVYFFRIKSENSLMSGSFLVEPGR